MFLTISDGDWRGDQGEKHLGLGGCIDIRFVGQIWRAIVAFSKVEDEIREDTLQDKMR